MKTLPYLLISLFLIVFSCEEKEEPILGVDETIWVYSYPVPCNPSLTPSTPCLGFNTAEEFDFNWASLEIIPFEIVGFTFKPTYLQRLLVSKTENPTFQEIKRKLIGVLEVEKDFVDILVGSWEIKRQLGKDFPNPDFPNGHSFSLFSFPRVAVSSDGCNQMVIEIKKVTENKIVSFGDLTMTLRSCFPNDPKIEPFAGFGNNSKIEGKTLTFYSEDEGEIAV